jgi:hypothetical protein
MTPKSWTLTKEVLSEGKNLQATITGLLNAWKQPLKNEGNSLRVGIDGKIFSRNSGKF